MKLWKNILVLQTVSILRAIELIDANSLQLVLVVDECNHLLGTVSDGDIRRAILKGISLQEPVQTIMFSSPSVAGINSSRDSIIALMKSRQLRHIPVVDETGAVVGLEVWDDFIDVKQTDNYVVIMAGGLGTRLGNLTKDCPKPMLKIGNKPILETILDSCKEYGFHNFILSVNYRADMVKEYFGDGSCWGVNIKYIHEAKRLGTAGALGLLQEKSPHPFLIINGDVLTKINYKHLLDFHRDCGASATMCVREFDFKVPYGVVTIHKHRFIGIKEKPVQKVFVNAGIYVLEPECLDLIPRDEYFDMPTLFEKLVEQRSEIAVFPIREYWLDIGRIDDFEQAAGEFSEVFE